MKRLKRTILNTAGHRAKIYFDPEWEEYIVKFFTPDGQSNPEEDYFTGDFEDATKTAEAILGM